MTRRPAGSGLTCRSPWDARALQLRRLAGELFDVLVIGGGVTGCGVALDAASRGLSVALIEKRDFAAGTSSRSSKLIHGGLRYLERLDLGLVREALHERRLLVERLAPHLVHPTPFLLPLEHGIRDRAYLGAGLFLYDALAGARPAMPRHRHLSHDACLRAVPSLRRRRPHRRHPLLRRPGRRRPLRRDAGAHGVRPGRRLRPRRRGDGVPPRRRGRDRASTPATSRAMTSSTSTPASWSTAPACGPPRWSASPAWSLRCRCGRRRASTSSCPGRASTRGYALILPHREERALRAALGRPLDHRHHRHRLGVRPRSPVRQPRRHRLPARARQRGPARPAHE